MGWYAIAQEENARAIACLYLAEANALLTAFKRTRVVIAPEENGDRSSEFTTRLETALGKVQLK